MSETNLLQVAKIQQTTAQYVYSQQPYKERHDAKLLTGLARTNALIAIAEELQQRHNYYLTPAEITRRLRELRIQLEQELGESISTAECSIAAVLYDVAKTLGVSRLSVLGKEAYGEIAEPYQGEK